MGTPYETTGARSRLSGLSCRPQGSDVRPQGQPVRPRGHIRPSQALSEKEAPGRQGHGDYSEQVMALLAQMGAPCADEQVMAHVGAGNGAHEQVMVHMSR